MYLYTDKKDSFKYINSECHNVFNFRNVSMPYSNFNK